MSRATNAVRALFAVVAVAAIVAGPPAMLLWTVGNPWPGRTAIDLRDETAIVSGILAVLLWVVWIRLCLLLGVELVRQARWTIDVRAANRQRSPGSRPVEIEPVPAASPGLGVLAQRLVAMLLIVVPLLTKSPRPAEAVPALPVTAPADPTETRDVPLVIAPAAAAPALDRTVDRHPEITVSPNDTLRSIARDHLGDASRWREIFELNATRTQVDGRRLVSPSALHTGWQLRLPPGAHDRTAPAPQAGAAADHAPVVHHYTTQPGDGPWHIAEALVGDGTRWYEVLAANEGVEVAPGVVWSADQEMVHPGWTFRWTGDDLPAPLARPTSAFVPEAAITIEAGDTLWRLSEERLDRAGMGGTRPTIEYVGEIVDANRSVIEDPDLVFPGERIVLPAIGDPPAVERDRPTGDTRDHEPARREPTRQRRSVQPDRPDRPEQSDRPEPGLPERHARDRYRTPPTTDDTPPKTQTTPVPTTVDTTQVPVPVPGAPDAAADVSPPDSKAPVGFGVGAMAVGVLAVLESRRRRRLRAASVRSRLPDRPPDIVDTERVLRRVEGAERHARIDLALRSAASSMVAGERRVAAVIVDERGAITVIADGAVALAAPWVSAQPGSARWELPAAVSLEDLADAGRHIGAPCAALAPVGITPSGGDVFVDLECVGTLAVDGELQQADQVLRGVAAGLAGSVLAESAHLLGVGVPVSAFVSHPNHHDVESVDEALDLSGDLLGPSPRGENAFRLRARRTGGETWETVVIFVPGSHAAELRDEELPSGVAAVVAAGGESFGGARLVPGVESWELAPYGIELTPVGLTTAEMLQIDELLASEDAAALDPLPAQEPASADAGDDWDLLVRVVGLVDVVDREGNRGDFSKSKSLELLAWAATHRDRSTRQGARSALWEVDVRDATFANIVSEARRATARLREPPVGEEWLARTMNATLVLHDRVITDAALMARRLDRARRASAGVAIDSLRSAVELIRGVPFAESGYLWPDAEGITSQLVVLATSCCTELASRLLDEDDLEGVFWATGQGLKVLPGHEELIGLRMRAHARKGDRAAVRQEWEAYERVVLADPWSDGEPAPELVRLRQELLAPATTPD